MILDPQTASRVLVETYARTLGEGPPIVMLRGSLSEQMDALRRAIDRGSPLRSDELHQPPPGADI